MLLAPGVQMKCRQVRITDHSVKTLPICHKISKGLISGDTVFVDRTEKPLRDFQICLFDKFKIFFFGETEDLAFVRILPAEYADRGTPLCFQVIQQHLGTCCCIAVKCVKSGFGTVCRRTEGEKNRNIQGFQFCDFRSICQISLAEKQDGTESAALFFERFFRKMPQKFCFNEFKLPVRGIAEDIYQLSRS